VGVVWSTPVDVAVPPVRSAVRGFPADWIMQLKRVVALVGTGAPLTPVDSRREYERGKALVYEEAAMLASHLICHSVIEGYFVPVDLDAPVFLPDGSEVAGNGVVGSSQGLLRELQQCAGPLGIALDDTLALSDDEAARVASLPDDDDLAVESVAWLALHEACLASVASGHAIIFS
jgi:hypothetical protein